MRYFTIFTIAALLCACGKQVVTGPRSMNISYLALGDSYTVGESVPERESFPFLLAQKLGTAKIAVAAPRIIAKTGWTTGELIAAVREARIADKYDIVTLLIGVNNQYRGYDQNTYRTEFAELLHTAASFSKTGKAGVFVVSIPDWGVTPFARRSGKEPAKVAVEINAFNAINKDEALKAGISYTDITAGSREAAGDPSLIAADGLHPSGKMYESWADALFNLVAAQR